METGCTSIIIILKLATVVVSALLIGGETMTLLETAGE